MDTEKFKQDCDNFFSKAKEGCEVLVEKTKQGCQKIGQKTKEYLEKDGEAKKLFDTIKDSLDELDKQFDEKFLNANKQNDNNSDQE